ncbi:hypothetical protein CCR80_02280 [Rhodothalassium salexigens]|nr:hypothetical protein [Rhodothalassium salexigens]
MSFVTALYAQPDHRVVETLLPGITETWLPPAAAAERFEAVPGLVPVAVRPTGGVGRGLLYVADLGTHPFREWQFMYTLDHLARAGLVGERFVTDLSVLDQPGVGRDGLDPQGLILHVSRCGSTLLSKALARLDDTVMITQGGPLQRGFWAAQCDDWRDDLLSDPATPARLRTLVRLMTRRRRGHERRAFVKFISWNVMVRDTIERAWAGTPTLFLYRDPVEVIASVFKETTAVLEAKGTAQAAFLTGQSAAATETMPDADYLAHCYRGYFKAALDAPMTTPLTFLNYRQMKEPSRFQDVIARGLAHRPTAEQLGAMIAQFDTHSKDDANAQPFQDDDLAKRRSLPEDAVRRIRQICGDLTNRLDVDARNLYPAAAEFSPTAVLSPSDGPML